MEKSVLGKTLSLDSAPVHIAPGGSTLCILQGRAHEIADFLITLREEIAFGMTDVNAACADNASVSIYFGSADQSDFDAVHHNFSDISVEFRNLPENSQLTGLSMPARNLVIDALR